jgi:K+-sensing histidine kinase KdpD
MIYFRLETAEGKSYSNFELLKDLDNYIGQNTHTKHYLIRDVPEGKIELIATDVDADLLERNKTGKIIVQTYAKLIPLLEATEKQQSKQYNILVHNLVTTHSRLQDSIGLVLPEKKLARAKDHSEQLSITKGLMQSNPENAAESILDIAKRIVDLQAQLEGFKMLSGDAKLDIGEHNVKHILQNIIYPYYEEFADNQVGIKWHIDDEEVENNKIKTDYKILNVALHHLLNNAVKYTKPYSAIDIYFDLESKQIRLEMISVRIEKDELKKVFEFEYCGRNAPPEMVGDGIGMYMAKEAINLLGGDIVIRPDYTAKNDDVMGIKYMPNVFIIQLPSRNTP